MIKVKIDNKEYTVRMLAIDTPESVHPDKKVMKDFSSPDELDSLGYAYIGLKDLLERRTSINVGRGIGR